MYYNHVPPLRKREMYELTEYFLQRFRDSKINFTVDPEVYKVFMKYYGQEISVN